MKKKGKPIFIASLSIKDYALTNDCRHRFRFLFKVRYFKQHPIYCCYLLYTVLMFFQTHDQGVIN